MHYFEAETDHGTVLRADQAALIVDADGRTSVLLPKADEFSPHQLIVVAIAARVSDEGFIDELIEVLADLRARAN